MGRIKRDAAHQEESYRSIFRLIILIVSPIILGAFVYNINGYLNGVFFLEIQGNQGIGKPKIPMLTALAALIVDVVAVIALLLFTDLGIYALLAAMIIYSVVVCILNDFYMKKYLQYKNPWKEAYLKPPAAVIIYFVLYLFVGKPSDADILSMPGEACS